MFTPQSTIWREAEGTCELEKRKNLHQETLADLHQDNLHLGTKNFTLGMKPYGFPRKLKWEAIRACARNNSRVVSKMQIISTMKKIIPKRMEFSSL